MAVTDVGGFYHVDLFFRKAGVKAVRDCDSVLIARSLFANLITFLSERLPRISFHVSLCVPVADKIQRCRNCLKIAQATRQSTSTF